MKRRKIMREISVRSIYNAGILSQSAGWKSIYENLEQLGIVGSEEEVCIDFKGVSIIEPGKHDYFKMILKSHNIHMRFYNIESTVKQLKVMCILEGYNPDRISNINPVVAKKLTSQEKRVLSTADGLVDIMDLSSDGVLRIKASSGFSQMNDGTTIMAMEEYINRMIKRGDRIVDVIIELGSMIVHERVIEMMVDLKIRLRDNYNIDMAFDVNSAKVFEKLNLYLHSMTNIEYTDERKIKELRDMGVNAVGVLIKYKKSRAVDAFGRHGNGEIASSRVAILKEIVTNVNLDGRKETFARFTTYSSSTLYTKNHWSIERDGEQLEELDTYDISVRIADLGITDKVIGSWYHFALPIQEREEDSIYMYNGDSSGKVYSTKMTLPERIKAVFDDFDVEYNKKGIDDAIVETQALLGQE